MAFKQSYSSTATTGLISRDGSGNLNTRTLSIDAGSSGILAWTNADGVSGNPSLAITIASININGLTGGPLNVNQGGTGDNTFTLNSVIIGNAASQFKRTLAGTTGTVLTGVTGATPAFSATPSLTSLTLSTPLAVGSGGTGASTLAATTLLQGNGTSAVTASNTLSADFTVTNAANSIRTLSVTNTSNTSSAGSVIHQSVAGTTAASCYQRWAVGSSISYCAGVKPSNLNFTMAASQDGTVTPATGTVILNSDWNGQVTFPNSCCFLIYANLTTSAITGDGTIAAVPLTSTLWDLNSNTLSSAMSAPVTGKYFQQINLGMTGITSSNTSFVVTLTTSNRSYQVGAGHPFNCANASGNLLWSGSTECDMDAGDTASLLLNVAGVSKNVSLFGVTSNTLRTWWSGKLIS